uniref:Uncharacterized protein n=1 Tax=Amphimedon queenslandica TaxID=400682 RepID=A0A1X7U9L4_AMPQE
MGGAGAACIYVLQCCYFCRYSRASATVGTTGVALSLILVSHSLFKHKLENVSLIKNQVKLIVRVLCYARKHKYPENRSALTYWEEEAPSRLDLGKDKYGGSFTEEEVEDVKTFFRMLPLFIAVVGFGSALFLWIPLGKAMNKSSIVDDHYQRYMEQEDEYKRHKVTLENEKNYEHSVIVSVMNIDLSIVCASVWELRVTMQKLIILILD